MSRSAHGQHAKVGREHRRLCTADVKAFHIAPFAGPCLYRFRTRREVVAENVDELYGVADEGVDALGVMTANALQHLDEAMIIQLTSHC